MNLIHRRHVYTALIGFGLFLGAPAWSAEPLSEIKACAEVEDPGARLACFDQLAERLQDEEVAVKAASAAEVNEAVASSNEPAEAALPEHLGGADFEEQAENFETRHQGTITRCEQASDGRWYFWFNNGQVWRQSNRERQRFRECNFLATVSRDAFGYKMVVDVNGKQKSTRVSRVK